MKASVIRAIAAKDLHESAREQPGARAGHHRAAHLRGGVSARAAAGAALLARRRGASRSSTRSRRTSFRSSPGLTDQGKAAYIATAYLFSAFFLIIPAMMATTGGEQLRG